MSPHQLFLKLWAPVSLSPFVLQTVLTGRGRDTGTSALHRTDASRRAAQAADASARRCTAHGRPAGGRVARGTSAGGQWDTCQQRRRASHHYQPFGISNGHLDLPFFPKVQKMFFFFRNPGLKFLRPGFRKTHDLGIWTLFFLVFVLGN